MWQVVFLVCVACFVVLVSSETQTSSYASASSSTSSCGGGGGGCAQSAAAAASGGSSCGAGGCGNTTQQCTGPNETFDACPATCPPQQCGVDPALILCAPNPEYGDPDCKPGCRCIDGYVRNENNECIPRDSCPNAGCNGDPNAIPGCGVNCGRTCATYNKGPQSCITICYENACDCKKDYVFDDNQRRCVLPRDCSCNGDPNATPGCGVNCGRTCATYNSSEPTFCTAICNENGCDCKDGFVFDDNQKKCVRPQDCIPKCGPNEIPSNCSNGGCGPFTCADLGSPIKCVRPQTCEVGCICQNTYVRNNSGVCVPKDQCTGSCGGDPNAVPGCGVNCGKTCATYQAKNPICPRICKPNGCDCKPGYVFDPNVNKCVLPGYCSPSCGPNEKYCRCRKRCSCQKGTYAQTSAGTCVRN